MNERAPMKIEQEWVDAYNAVWQIFPDLDASNVDECRRLALSAVAPLIRAAALDEAAKVMEPKGPEPDFALDDCCDHREWGMRRLLANTLRALAATGEPS